MIFRADRNTGSNAAELIRALIVESAAKQLHVLTLAVALVGRRNMGARAQP